jgi:hypothetical protein
MGRRHAAKQEKSSREIQGKEGIVLWDVDGDINICLHGLYWLRPGLIGSSARACALQKHRPCTFSHTRTNHGAPVKFLQNIGMCVL